MHTRIVLLVLLTAVTASCKSVDCGEGTSERNGICVPSNETIGTAQCGPFTELHGNLCVPKFPPTLCDPDTTSPDMDSMGVVTCIGTGGGGCSAKIACPTPTNGKQAICGQIFDFETNEPFAQPGATGAACAPGATTGPCAVGIKAYDAAVFASTGGAQGQLTTGPVVIDDCGRYRVPDITQPGPPGLIALGFDDAAPAAMGPPGVTNAVGVATTAAPSSATKDFEAFVVRSARSSQWTGGPALSAGIYAAVYRGHRTGTDLASGVTLRLGLATNPPPTGTDIMRDFYFPPASTTRGALDAAASTTGMNGTALLSGATLTELYSGSGAIPSQCAWEIHAGAAIPFVVFIQLFRPTNFPGMTCPL